MTENVFEDHALQKYLNEIASVPPLSREVEHELALKAQKGDQDAIDKLITANLKFVVKIATKYQNRGLKFAELISEGNMGLIKAIEKFDPEKDIKLISYAVWWIKQRILFALAEKTSLIRVPLGKSNSANKIRIAKEKKLTQTGEVATLDDLLRDTDLNAKQIRKIELRTTDALSIDDVSFTNKNEEFHLSDFLEDTDTNDPQKDYLENKMMSKIEESINNLNERERYIIKTYFGLDGQESKNFAEMADDFNLSRERIRQIQKEALAKILNDVTDELSTDVNQMLM